jgi:hypothetical protein
MTDRLKHVREFEFLCFANLLVIQVPISQHLPDLFAAVNVSATTRFDFTVSLGVINANIITLSGISFSPIHFASISSSPYIAITFKNTAVCWRDRPRKCWSIRTSKKRANSFKIARSRV